MNKCVFLDRDGVLNMDKVDYVYKVDDLHILHGVPEALEILKKNNYLLIVITNQSGIDKQIFTEIDVSKVHGAIQDRTGNVIDEFYFSQYHRTLTNSLATKPGSLLFEKAISKYNINPKESWMIGDRVRDLIPAALLGIKTILIEGDYKDEFEGVKVKSLLEAVNNYVIN